jgi:hypothetical protein
VIFRPELAAKVLAGEKTVTRRLCSPNPRSPWWRDRTDWPESMAVQAKRGTPTLARIRILSVQREQLGLLTLAEALREGFESVTAFRVAWGQINGSYDPRALVWRVEFEVEADA